jgi:AcrR family transcriptional regulator
MQRKSTSARVLKFERRPDERPQELLDAALTVFAERGYRNARIDDVAEAAGVTKGAVYHHFANKEELLRRAIEAHQEQTFGELEAALRKLKGPASVRIRLLLRRSFSTSEPNRRRVLALLLQGVKHDVPDVHRQWLVGGPVKGWKLLTALIERGQDTGEFRADVDAEVAARVVLSGLMTQMVWQGLGATIPEVAIDEDRLIDSSIDLLLHGLLPVAPGR